jgi:hypothetical protein
VQGEGQEFLQRVLPVDHTKLDNQQQSNTRHNLDAAERADNAIKMPIEINRQFVFGLNKSFTITSLEDKKSKRHLAHLCSGLEERMRLFTQCVSIYREEQHAIGTGK